MLNVLADLAIESEAATATALRLARAYDEGDTRFRRFATAVLEVLGLQARDAARRRGARVPRRQRLRRGVADAAAATRRAAERDLGGLGQRHARSTSCARWRASPRALPAFLAECELARGADARLDAHLDALKADLAALDPDDAQWLARRAIVEDLAVAFQASLLVRNAPAAVADAFCAGRLEERGRVYGTLPTGVDGPGDRGAGAGRLNATWVGGRVIRPTYGVLGFDVGADASRGGRRRWRSAKAMRDSLGGGGHFRTPRAT